MSYSQPIVIDSSDDELENVPHPEEAVSDGNSTIYLDSDDDEANEVTAERRILDNADSRIVEEVLLQVCGLNNSMDNHPPQRGGSAEEEVNENTSPGESNELIMSYSQPIVIDSSDDELENVPQPEEDVDGNSTIYLDSDDGEAERRILDNADSRIVEEVLLQVCGLNDPPQCGGSAEEEVNENTPPEESNELVTKVELEFFSKYAEIIDNEGVRRKNSKLMLVDPVRLRFKADLPADAALNHICARIFDIYIRKMLGLAGGNLSTTVFWLGLLHPGWKEQKGFWIRHRCYDKGLGTMLMSQITDFMKSAKTLKLDDAFRLEMNIFKSNPDTRSEPRDELVGKFFLTYPNRVFGPTHCLAKALCLGKLYADHLLSLLNGRVNEAKALKNEFEKLTVRPSKPIIARQLQLAQDLLIAAGLDPCQASHSFEDLKKLAAHLYIYRIKVWVLDATTKKLRESLSFNDDKVTSPGLITLVYDEEKYRYDFVIPSYAGFKLCYCNKCIDLVKKHHVCKSRCDRCGFYDCNNPSNDNEKITCLGCEIWFRNQKCYEQHRQKSHPNALTWCARYVKCPKCLVPHLRPEIGQKRNHFCPRTYCRSCNDDQRAGHECCHGPPAQKRAKVLEAREESTTNKDSSTVP